MTLKNPKAIYLGEWYIVDAPEKPNMKQCEMPCRYGNIKLCTCNDYYIALSNAPRWKVKEQEECNLKIYQSQPFTKDLQFYSKWQPEQGRVYDLPKGYRVKLAKECDSNEICNSNCDKCMVALLIPEEEVKTIGLRAVRVDLFSPCEKAILNAQYELEKVGASEGLTKAATLLSEARQLVTDYLWNNK